MLKTYRNLKHRFFWKTDHKRFEPFLPFFTILNLIIGLLFAFGSFIPRIAELKLFVVLTAFLPAPFNASIWGIALVLVFIGHCLEMYYRGKGIGPNIAMVGFILWCYALGIYLSDFTILGIIGIVVPQLFFWGWYFIESKRYGRELRKGEVEVVS